MRSKWSAEGVLIRLAVASMEGAWLTLVYVGLQWLVAQPALPLGILDFSATVLVGMFVARRFANLSQTNFATVIAAVAVGAAVIGMWLSGVEPTSPGDFLRTLVLSPSSWVLGLAVLRGAAQADPGSTFSSERVFQLGIPGLVVYWVMASTTAMVHNVTFAGAAFAATLTFVSSGLLAMGLSRLSDLEVDAVDRAAQRRWIVLLVVIVGVVLIIGIPLAGLLGVPVSAAVAGVLGPLAPLLIGLFYLMSIPIFFLLDLLSNLVQALHLSGGLAPLPTHVPQPTNLPPLIEPTTSAAPDLTWVIFVIVGVCLIVLVRLLALLLARPSSIKRNNAVDEVRAAEPITLPALPHLPRLRLAIRRPAPSTAIEAYRLSLIALAAGPNARLDGETPREHASRIVGSNVGRDMGRLAADYQLGEFAAVRLTARETRRALERWRRVVTRARQRR